MLLVPILLSYLTHLRTYYLFSIVWFGKMQYFNQILATVFSYIWQLGLIFPAVYEYCYNIRRSQA